MGLKKTFRKRLSAGRGWKRRRKGHGANKNEVRVLAAAGSFGAQKGLRKRGGPATPDTVALWKRKDTGKGPSSGDIERSRLMLEDVDIF